MIERSSVGQIFLRLLVAMILATAPGIASTQSLEGELPRRGAIGVALDPDVSAGVVVTEIQPGSAGERAGLKSGDTIRAIDGVNMTSVAAVQAAIGQRREGDNLTLVVERADESLTLTANLGRFPV